MELTATFFSLLWLYFMSIFVYRLVNILYSQRYFKRIAFNDGRSRPFLSVIVPARDEERNISLCVESLASQHYPTDRYEIIVVNDNSIDNTKTIMLELALKYPHIKFIDAPLLPDNWAGKNHACYNGYLQATGEYLCFTDADTAAGKELLKHCVNFALQEKTDLLSFSPMQNVVSTQEKLILPGIFLCIAGAFNINSVNNPLHKRAIANGQFLMFKRSAYEAIGTHKAIRNKINDDITFAKIIKKFGLKLFFSIGTKEQFSARMYKDAASAWKGFSKNLSDIVDADSTRKLLWQSLYTGVLSIGAYAVPLGIIFTGWTNTAALLIGAGSFVFWSIIVSSALQLRLSWIYMLWLPASFWLYLLLLYQSYKIKFTSRSIEWKGRVY